MGLITTFFPIFNSTKSLYCKVNSKFLLFSLYSILNTTVLLIFLTNLFSTNIKNLFEGLFSDLFYFRLCIFHLSKLELVLLFIISTIPMTIHLIYFHTQINHVTLLSQLTSFSLLFFSNTLQNYL